MGLKVFTNFLAAVKFLWPHIKPSYSNVGKPLALLCSCLIPFIDIIFFNNSTENKKNSHTSSDEAYTFSAVVPLIMLTGGFCTKFVLNKYIVESLKKSIQISNTEKLLDGQSKFLMSEGSTIESLQEITIGRRVDNIAQIIVPACVSVPVDIISILSSIVRIHLVTKSSLAITYACTITSLSVIATYVLGKPIVQYINEGEAVNSKILAKSSFIESNKESILLMGAMNVEREGIVSALKTREAEIPKFSILSGIHFFVSNIGGQLFSFLLPDYLTKKLSVDTITYLNLSVGLLINNALDLTTMYTQGYPFLEDNLDRFNKFYRAYDKWVETYANNNNLIQEFNSTDHVRLDLYPETLGFLKHRASNDFIIENFSVYLNKDVILDETHMVLESNKIYRLAGESGCGKTTILKALVNCWPYAKGRLVYPIDKESICFIPQKICIPQKHTLLEIISYPSTVSKLKEKYECDKLSFIGKVISLLTLAKLLPDVIKEYELESKGIEWSQKLSGGQKQKIAIIGALVKKPLLLIMDEPTAGLDDFSKKNIYAMIKQGVISPNNEDGKDSIVIYTDHNPIKDFADGVLIIDDQHHLKLIGVAE